MLAHLQFSSSSVQCHVFLLCMYFFSVSFLYLLTIAILFWRVQVCLSHLSQLLVLMRPWVSRKRLLCPVSWYLFIAKDQLWVFVVVYLWCFLARLCARVENRWALFKKAGTKSCLPNLEESERERERKSFEALNSLL